MRYSLFAIGLLLLFFGCLLQPYPGEANLTKKTGCAYSSPPCEENYTCINNTCVPNPGCTYSNPPCLSNETCINNSCVLKPGCDYNNPACSEDYDCKDNQCIEKIICGKFGCQAGEEASCCQDCGCPGNEVCDESGICLVQGANVEMSVLAIQSLPPVVLHKIHPKTIEMDAGPLAEITLTNRGTLKAYNVGVRSEVQGYSGTVLQELGMLEPKESRAVNLTQLLNSKALGIENGTTTILKIFLDYKGVGTTNSSQISASLYLPGRNTFDWRIPGAMAVWADSTDRTIIKFADDATLKSAIQTDTDRERAARQVYSHLQSFGITHTGDSRCYNDSLKFPAEALRDGSGNCADLSVLYSAILEAAGVKSVLIKNDNIVMPGFVKADGTVVPVDMRGIGKDDFEKAKINGLAEHSPGSMKFFPQELWGSGIGRANLGIEVLVPDIMTTSSNCVLVPGMFNVHYWFENKGYANGVRCLKAVLYEGNADTEYFSKRVCAEVPALQKRNITFSVDIPKSATVTGKCWID